MNDEIKINAVREFLAERGPALVFSAWDVSRHMPQTLKDVRLAFDALEDRNYIERVGIGLAEARVLYRVRGLRTTIGPFTITGVYTTHDGGHGGWSSVSLRRYGFTPMSLNMERHEGEPLRALAGTDRTVTITIEPVEES